jgi:Mlc titration factor MtfA (ptsG expression regulator)
MPPSDKLCGIVDNISTKIALATSKNINELLSEYLPKLLQLIVYPDDKVRNKVRNRFL